MPPVEPMTSSLDHLPDDRRRALARIQAALFEEFRAAVAAAPPKIGKAPEILKIVLFGRAPDRVSLLVVVNHKALANRAAYWQAAEARIESLSADVEPAGLIVHSLGEVNEALESGGGFFIEIIEQGVLLFEKRGHPFRRPRRAAAAALLKEAEGAFAHWRDIAQGFVSHYQSDLAAGRHGLAAFSLHQATECLSSLYLLVTGTYSPKSHDLRHLLRLLESRDARFLEVWPSSGGGRRAFSRLNRAYSEARYSRCFEIERDELVWLGERVTRLQALVGTLCAERIAMLRMRAMAEGGAPSAGEACQAQGT